MLEGISKKGIWNLFWAFFLLIIASICLFLFGIDFQGWAQGLAKRFVDSPPLWVGHPLTHTLLVVIGIAIFVFVDIWDKSEYRKWLIKTPLPTIRINEAINYLCNDASIDLPIDPPDRPGVRALAACDKILEQACAGHIDIWGSRLRGDNVYNQDWFGIREIINREFWGDNEFTGFVLCDDNEVESETRPRNNQHMINEPRILWLNEVQLKAVFPPKILLWLKNSYRKILHSLRSTKKGE